MDSHLAGPADPGQTVIKRLLLIFAKQPQPGWSKTRLAADVGPGAADVLYRAFLADVASRAYQLQERLSVHIRWVHTPSTPSFAEVLDAVAPGTSTAASFVGYDTQDLTGQQHDQLLAAESEGFLQVIIMGADTPHVELEVLVDSFRSLDDNDVVVGPATDGGYYLLGLRSGWDLVAGLDMSSRDVRDDLVVTATHRGYSVGFAAPTMDIDTAADLRELIARSSLRAASCPATCRAVHKLGLWA
ncbi:MAG: TIGR04282 family arsenosugar biosynthesis glycosyltransferase [Pseudonocardiaceae bacterium]